MSKRQTSLAARTGPHGYLPSLVSCISAGKPALKSCDGEYEEQEGLAALPRQTEKLMLLCNASGRLED